MKRYWLREAVLFTLLGFAGCVCGLEPADEVDAGEDSGAVTGDASIDGGVVDFDAADTDALSVDAATGTDSAMPVDAAGTDSAGAADASTGEDAGSVDAAAGVDATPATDGATAADAHLPDVIVGNQPPLVAITDPPDGEYLLSTEAVDLSGTAVDPEDGPLTGGDLVWTSDVNGQFGLGEDVTSSLSPGTHVITLTATDSQGLSGQDSVTIHLVDNLPPDCTINNPDDGDGFMEGDQINFGGFCFDPEGSFIDTADQVWASDLDGDFGTGPFEQIDTLSNGSHVITLCVPDPDDAQVIGCDSISVLVTGNTAPTCAIIAPADGAGVPAGEMVSFEATASDGEDPDITGQNLQIQWESDQSGFIGLGLQTTEFFGNGDTGDHLITLTVTDSGGEECTDTITVSVSRPPSVSIDTVEQGGDPSEPFADDAPIDFTGSATDPDGDSMTYSWIDSLGGAFGAGTSASLASPIVGRHTVVLTATDQNGVSASDVVSFDVLAAGQTDLIEEYADVNDAFNNAGDDSVRAMAATAAGQIYGANNDVDVLQFDGGDPAATGAVVLDDQVLPDNVRDIWLDEAGGLIYLATQDGLVVCAHDAVTGVDDSACDTYQDGDIPGGDADLRAVALVTGSDGADYLVYGNDEGILIADSVTGSDTGTTGLAGIEIRDIAVAGGVLWIGTNGDGLYRYDPVSGDTQSWDQGDGAPGDAIVTVAVGTDGMIWAGSNNGLGRFDPGAGTWTVWRQFDPPAPGLISNSVRAIAIHHVDIGGVARDVIWIGCGGFGGGFTGGVSRFDPTVPSFTNFTTADGLPSNNVRSIIVLSDGTKVFGTDSGVARYVGL